MHLVLQLLLATLAVNPVPIQNSLYGDVQVECDSRTISVQIKTEKPFVGVIFVKDFASEEVCTSRGTGRLSAFLEIEIGLCGALRQRVLNPKGLAVRTTITISFHPYFITKVDRTYNLLCLYRESQVTVANNISVDEISTISYNVNLTMPTCTYQILSGGPFGEPVEFGLIGQQVYHQWKCDNDKEDSFCMVVHTCSVDDGRGETSFLIDSNGCSIDKFLLSNLEYPGNLLAGQEAHVYKFADRDALFFQCQISITVKEPDQECVRPICEDVEGGGAPVVGPPPYGFSQKTQVSFNQRAKRSETSLDEQITDVRTRFSVSYHFDIQTNSIEIIESCVLLSTMSIPFLLFYILILILTSVVTVIISPKI